MAKFEVPLVRIERVEDHPNAERLSLMYFKEYVTISSKLDDGSPRYKVDDLVAYVPEGAVVPDDLLKDGFWNEKDNKGILAGSKGNRVKAMRLRGILSQGIMFPVKFETVGTGEVAKVGERVIAEQTAYWSDTLVGPDFSTKLGIVKYEPPVPATLAGEVYAKLAEHVENFDVENMKRYPEIIQDGEQVVGTEKLHGTLMGIGYVPTIDDCEVWGRFFCFSKGLGKQGFVFKNNEVNAKKNTYVKHMNELYPVLNEYAGLGSQKFTMFGEVFGHGIQDLQYGLDKPEFRLFAVKFNGTWWGWDAVEKFAKAIGVKTVPVLYRGPFSQEIRKLRDGLDTINGVNVREGVVWSSDPVRTDPTIGRVMLKDVSDDYLTRKGGTEFN